MDDFFLFHHDVSPRYLERQRISLHCQVLPLYAWGGPLSTFRCIFLPLFVVGGVGGPSSSSDRSLWS
jgi:hypothetical protein